MKLYHPTDRADEILESGFRDEKCTSMTPEIQKGVFLSNRPLDENKGDRGRVVLTVEIPESFLKPYEWTEDGTPYREFLVPAAIVNRHGPPVVHEFDSKDEQLEEHCTRRSVDDVDWLREFVLRVLDGTNEGHVLRTLMGSPFGETVGGLASLAGLNRNPARRAAKELVRRGLALEADSVPAANGGTYSGYRFAPVKFPELEYPPMAEGELVQFLDELDDAESDQPLNDARGEPDDL